MCLICCCCFLVLYVFKDHVTLKFQEGEHLELFRLLRRRVAVIWCKSGLNWSSIDGVIAVYGCSQIEVLDFDM